MMHAYVKFPLSGFPSTGTTGLGTWMAQKKVMKVCCARVSQGIHAMTIGKQWNSSSLCSFIGTLRNRREFYHGSHMLLYPSLGRARNVVPCAGTGSADEDEEEKEIPLSNGESDIENNEDDFPDIDSLVEMFNDSQILNREAKETEEEELVDRSYDDSESDADAEINRGYPERPVRQKRLAELLSLAGYEEEAQNAPDIIISNIITCNSETPAEGSLYVCVPSDDGHHDGHDWANEAADIGAVAIIASRPIEGCLVPVIIVDNALIALGRLANIFFDKPSAATHTIAFIGSYGKTTSAWLLRSMLEVNAAEPTVAMVGDSEYSISADLLTKEGDLWEQPMVPVDGEDKDGSNVQEFVPLDITHDRRSSTPHHLTPYQGKYELPEATPDGLHLHKVLAGAVDRGAGAAIVEVCPLLAADGRVAELSPEVLVFTNIADEMARKDAEGADAYVERVSAMFENLGEYQTAIVNLDDPYGPLIARMVADSEAQLVTFSLKDKDADVYPEKMKPSIWETDIVVRTPLGKLNIICSLIGPHNMSNLLSAISASLALGVPLEDIVQGAEETQFIPGRCEIIDQEQQFPVIVDAARSPEQLVRFIDAIKDAGARRTILVVGCPGSFSPEMRAQIGSAAHLTADVVFFTNDSYGRVPPDRIISDTVGGMPEDVLGRHPGSYYPWMQDKSRVPQWFEPWLLRYQSEINRYVIEDRRSAIRVAVGLAKPRDVVVIAGRGDKDYLEVWDGLTPLDMRGQSRSAMTTDGERELEAAIAGGSEMDMQGDEYQTFSKQPSAADGESLNDGGDWTWNGEDGYWELEAFDPSTGESWIVSNGDEMKWDAARGEYVWERSEDNEPMQLTGTVKTWFSDRLEALSAVEELFRLDDRKDLDRSTLPWTRYPEEREQSGLSPTVGGELAAVSGQELDQYLRDVTSRGTGVGTFGGVSMESAFDDEYDDEYDDEGSDISDTEDGDEDA